MENQTERKKVSIRTLKKMKDEGEPIVMLTCYDASFAALEDQAGVDMMLVGDSLGMTIQGNSSTLGVSIEDMVYHTKCVAKGNKTAFIVSDMSFGSYLVNEDEGVANAVKLMQAGANMVKIEGGLEVTSLVRRLTTMGIPVCGHLGFTPQSVNAIGGYYVQGRGEKAEQLKKSAIALEEAGASCLVMEMVPTPIATEVTQALKIPTISIGAGIGCSGQVLVLQDVLGIYPNRKFRFAKNFMVGSDSIQTAVRNYVKAVKNKEFPAPENSFSE